jgi:hypothetical protein
VCMPGTVRDVGACGMCGTSQETCGPTGEWGASVCVGESGVCIAGATQMSACGNCGTQTQTCQSDCTWGAFGACGNQGTCTPGTVTCDNFSGGGALVYTCSGAACGANAACSTCLGNGAYWDFYVCDTNCTLFNCTAAPECAAAICN